MRKLNWKWYIAVIVIPIIINYFTDTVKLSDIFNNASYIVIFCLGILVIALQYDNVTLKQNLRKINSTPNERDKKIINKLLKLLDVPSFQKEIYEQDSWNGYKIKSLDKVFDFIEQVELINNRTSDKVLNKLVEDLAGVLKKFAEYSGTHLYNDGGHYYTPDKNSEMNIKKLEMAQPVMNQMTTDAFNKLTVLLNYCRERNYLNN